jgi:hypothetical protein
MVSSVLYLHSETSNLDLMSRPAPYFCSPEELHNCQVHVSMFYIHPMHGSWAAVYKHLFQRYLLYSFMHLKIAVSKLTQKLRMAGLFFALSKNCCRFWVGLKLRGVILP